MFKPAPTIIAALLGLAAVVPAHAQSKLGGGFIEYLVTGNSGGSARYVPQPAPGYYPSGNGQTYAGRSYYADPPVATGRSDGTGARQPAMRPAYATAPGAIPDGLTTSEPTPTPTPRRARSGDVAYAPMPRVQAFDSKYEKQVVDYDDGHAAGTIVIDTPNKFLYLVQGEGKALRYGIGVGRPGFEWAGTKSITRKAEWPSWTPPAEMRKRRPDLPSFMEGGEDNPLGARALYLGSSLYRIHGTNEPSTIGQAVSSGCIRMRNRDVIDLYNRVRVGTRVVVI